MLDLSVWRNSSLDKSEGAVLSADSACVLGCEVCSAWEALSWLADVSLTFGAPLCCHIPSQADRDPQVDTSVMALLRSGRSDDSRVLSPVESVSSEWTAVPYLSESHL